MQRRKTFKNFMMIIALLTVSSFSYAQKGFNTISAQVDLGLPIGDFGQAYNVGFGASGKVFYGITEAGSATGSLGFMRYGIKEDSEYMSGSMTMVPIQVGYRHLFGSLYGEPQLGLMVLRSNVKFDDMGIGLSGYSGSSSTTKVTLGLGGGYMMNSWDLGARFQIVDNLNFFGVSVGYHFSL